MKAVQMRKEEAAAVLRTHAAAAVTAGTPYRPAHTGSPHRQAVPMLIGGGGLAAPTYRGAPAAPCCPGRRRPPRQRERLCRSDRRTRRYRRRTEAVAQEIRLERLGRSARGAAAATASLGRRTTVREQRVGPS